MLRVRRVRTGTRFLRWALAVSAALVAAPPPPAGAQTAGAQTAGAQTADARRALGKIERESVDDALASLGARIDPAPEGKTIGRIVVINQDVFSKRDWYFQLLNFFHWTTRGYILERELLLKPGQRWDQALVEESTRNLQHPTGIVIGGKTYGSPELSSVVVLLPIAPIESGTLGGFPNPPAMVRGEQGSPAPHAPNPGQVDLLVVTRDIWSLRFNTNYEYQGNALTLFESSLSENNLFGWRKYLSFGFSFDQGKYYYGPSYFDPNIHGTRLTLYAAARLYNSRETGNYEGNNQIVSLRYPLYSLASRWGAAIDVIHQNAVSRGFRGNDVRLVDLAGTPDLEMLPYEYRRRIVSVDGSAVRSFGRAVIQRVSAGYLVDRRRSEVLPDFPADAATAQLFLSQWAPLNEQRSEPYLRYEMFTPRYIVLRDLDTFDLRENKQLGPFFRARMSEGMTELGADFRAFGVGVIGGFAAGPAGSYLSLSGSASARYLHDGGRWIDQEAAASFYAATPLVDRLFRIVAGLTVDSKRADTANTPFALGGANGLRGYEIGEFLGTTELVGHIEIRTASVSTLFAQRFGALFFYDVGHAAPSLADLDLRNDVGLGLRWLSPQFNSTVLRFDWAVPLQDGVVTRAGMPGRFTAGMQQLF
jgi:outer membrane protein assembly factor BamA